MRSDLVGGSGIAITVALMTSVIAATSLQQSDATTPFISCGSDQVVTAPLAVRPETVALAADGRLYAPCAASVHTPNHLEVRQATVLAEAARSDDAEVRRSAAQAYGRVGVTIPGSASLARLLDDPDAGVRREAANAIGDAVSGVLGDLMTPPEPASLAEAVTSARRLLEARLATETNDDVVGELLETLGSLNYSDDAARSDVEALLVSHATGTPARIAGAVKGLEALIRHSPRRAIADVTRTRLRAIAGVVATGPRVAADGVEAPTPANLAAQARRLALAALQTARDGDTGTLIHAASDPDWQARRLVALRLDFARPELAPAAARLLDDPDVHVRYDVLAAEGREATRTKICAPLVRRMDDTETTVVLRAIDLLPVSCADAAGVIARLRPLADRLAQGGLASNWYVPAHAFATEARIDADAARRVMPSAIVHPVWQVRAAAATAAGVLGDEASAVKLAADSIANVRSAALDALDKMKSTRVVDAAMAALGSSDNQLLRTAANVLHGAPESARGAVTVRLLEALRRLTEEATDNARDPRVAIVQRLQELLAPSQAGLLRDYFTDVDPKVRAAATSAVSKLTQSAVTSSPTFKVRYPVQPSASTLARLPTHATITMREGATIELELLARQAPVSVARFAELARSGYYNGLTFHRVVPNFVVQGGSPGASEYTGVARFWRDELGTASNLRGTVGLSTRGHDSGDGQFFINLVDLPRLDHDYTVFANVTSGLAVIDRLLEGATIATVSVR